LYSSENLPKRGVIPKVAEYQLHPPVGLQRLRGWTLTPQGEELVFLLNQR